MPLRFCISSEFIYNTKGYIYHKWFKQKLIVLFNFHCSLLHFPDSSGDTSEQWPVRSPLLWVPIIPAAWLSRCCCFTGDIQHSLRVHYTLKIPLKRIFKVRFWRTQALNLCQIYPVFVPSALNQCSVEVQLWFSTLFDRKMTKFKEELKPFITSLISWTFFSHLCVIKCQKTIIHLHMPTCLTLCGHRAQANYCSHWALIQLLPSGLTTAERTWGAWEAERYAGRGSAALQLSIRCGDDPLLDWGGLEAEVRCRSVDSDHLYAFNCSPLVCSSLLQPTQSWECVPSHNTMDSQHSDLRWI